MPAYSSTRYNAQQSQPYQNYILNGEFLWNQRGFAGGSLSSGAYGYDRWKADGTGCSLSYSAPYLTVTGSLVQPIELPGFDDCYITVSADTGDTDPTVTLGADSGIFNGATPSGKLPLTAYIPPGFREATNNLYVYLGAGKYTQVQVTLGKTPPLYQRPHQATEFAALQRYYQKSYNPSVAPGTVTSAGRRTVQLSSNSTALFALETRLVTGMRSTPTVVWYSPTTGTANRVRRVSTPAADWTITSNQTESTNSAGFPVTSAMPTFNILLYAHFTADSEI